MDSAPPAANPQDKADAIRLREAQWRRVGGLLRSLLAHLAGPDELHGPVLDGTLGGLRDAMRETGGDSRIPTLLGVLAKAAKTLDEPAGHAEPAAPAPGASPAAHEILLTVLDHLQLEDPTTELAALRLRIAGCADTRTLRDHGHTLVDLVNERLRKLAEEREAAAQLLHHINGHLGTLAEYIAQDESAGQDDAQASSLANERLLDEVQILDDCASSASDLAALRRDIRARLSVIRDHLTDARGRELAREQEWQKRLKRSRHRVRQLEDDIERMESMLAAKGHLVDTDALTGLANRRALEARMPDICNGRPGTISLLMVDIDHFKEINDRLGHGAGDRALRIVAEQLQTALRPGDFLARFGGEEFVAILEAGAEEAMHVAERLRERLERTRFRSQDQPVRVTLSCGVATVQADDTPESVFDRADRALYQAKRAGRNRCMAL
ncbi:MAG: hypothetical protein RSP_27230 [Rhodanobacter sp.]